MMDATENGFLLTLQCFTAREVKLKLGRVLQECREEAEEKAASGEEPAGIASVLPERSQEVRRRAAALSRDAASLVSD